MKFVVRLLLVILPFTLSSCSYISKTSVVRGHDKKYLSARSISPLRVPPGLKSDAFHSEYPVSDSRYSKSAEDVDIIPPGLN